MVSDNPGRADISGNTGAFVAGNWHGRARAMRKDTSAASKQYVQMVTQSLLEKGDVNKAAFGQNPSGLLTYTADGRMMAIVSDGGRKPLSFTCGKVVTHVEIASLQNWVDTEQTRFVTLQDNRMMVRTRPCQGLALW